MAEQTKIQKLIAYLEQVIQEKDEQLANAKKIILEMRQKLEETIQKLEETEKKLGEEKSIQLQMGEKIQLLENIIASLEENHVNKVYLMDLNLINKIYKQDIWKLVPPLIGLSIMFYAIYRK